MMRDLRGDLGTVLRTATRIAPRREGGRCLMFASALSGEGTASIAASFALLAARQSNKGVWLVDLDLHGNRMFHGFEARFAAHVGRPGRAYDASLNQDPIYAVRPQLAGVTDAKLLVAHEIEGEHLLVTRFRTERLQEGQRAEPAASPGWWQAVRKIADWTIVHAPPLEHSLAALGVAAEMDGVVLVVNGETTPADAVLAARRDIEAHGGEVIGLVMNRRRTDARIADRLSG